MSTCVTDSAAAEVAIRLAHDLERLDDLRLLERSNDIVTLANAADDEISRRVDGAERARSGKELRRQTEQLSTFYSEEIT